MDVIRSLAKALDVRVSDFLVNRDENLIFTQGGVPQEQQAYCYSSVSAVNMGEMLGYDIGINYVKREL